MKIALIYPYLLNRGGSQRYVIELARIFKKFTIEVDLFIYEYNEQECYPELVKDINIYSVNRNSSNDNIKHKNIKKQKILLKKIYSNKLVKFFVNSLGLDYLASIFFTQKSSKLLSDLVVKQHKKYDLVFVHEEPLSVWAAIKYKKHTNTPIYWFCYDSIEKWYLEWNNDQKESVLRAFLLRKIYFLYDKYLIRKYVDRIAVLDANMQKRVKRLYDIDPLIRRGGIPEDVLMLNRDDFFRKKYNLSNDTVVIFALTRFARYRRVHDIFEMYSTLPDNIKNKIFVYINSPVTEEDYYEECKNNYKDIINSKGFIVDSTFPKNDEEMYRMYLSSDIFIFPNEKQTWGHAPLEAMGCGCSAVVSDGCGIYEIIKEITPDLTYKTGDIKALSSIIANLVENRSYMGYAKIQKEYVKDNLTWNKIGKQYIEDFNEILSNNGKKRIKLAYFAPHVVPYHVGIYREITKLDGIDFKVFYEDTIGLTPVYDGEFKKDLEWDVDLISGYEKEFMKNFSSNPMGGFFSRINFEIFNIFIKNKPDILIFQSYAKLSDWLIFILAKLTKTKIIFRGEATLRNNEARNKFKQVFLKWWLKNCDVVMYSCSGNKQYWEYYGVEKEKLFPIPCATDNDFFQNERKRYLGKEKEIKKELGIDENDFIIIFSARFTTRKRPLDLLKAVKKISNENITVLFVGDGLERENIEQYAKNNNIKAIFVGFKNQTELAEFYSIADLDIVISDYDPSPKAMNEAMNFELPVIVTDVVGTAYDLVKDGENGFIIKVGDIDALADKIDYLNKNRDIAKQMGKKSLEIVKEWSFEKDAYYVKKAVEYILENINES